MEADLASAPPQQCPGVGMVEDARSITLFRDKTKTVYREKQAQGYVRDFDGGCEYSAQNVKIDMDIVLDVSLGLKARIKGNDKPTIVLPYFVAITSPEEEVLAKEVFAAAVKFNSNEKEKTQVERLREVIPLKDISLGPNYRVYVGFQLTEDQLIYNRAQAKSKAPQIADPRIVVQGAVQ